MRKLVAMLILLMITTIASASTDYKEFSQKKNKQEGLVSIYYDSTSDKLYLSLEKAKLNQAFIFQSSMPHGIGSNDIGLDRGQLGNTRLVSFKRFGNKVLLNQVNTDYRATSANEAEQKSVDEAFADSVIAGFIVVSENSSHLIFDYTDFLLSDIHGIAAQLSQSDQGVYSVDKSRSGIYQNRTKAFPENTELEALVTFAGKAEGSYIKSVTPDANSVSVHLHHSFIELPDDNYKQRQFHPFSGFWKHSYIDYSSDLDKPMEQTYIPRHRLHKKQPDAAISEAVNPIIYYLDPGIPEPVMTALREGAMWWDQAFKAAGYKDAFQVAILPEGADPMDSRYNVIQWVHRATRGWSYGSSVVDPRTGEIIKGHVTLGSLRVRQDYLIALGMTSPFTTENSNTDRQLNMALDRIRQLSAHEVGHTLGIAHNFAASENNRASVMDYPHPLFSIENGVISMKNAYDQAIGEWDKQVIAYGYQDYPVSSNEANELLAIISQSKSKGLRYKSDPDARSIKTPSSDGHLWDNGSSPIDEFKRISEVRALALKQFGANSLPENTNYSSLQERLVPIYYAHRYQLDALVKQVSGIEYSYETKTIGTKAQGIKVVDAAIQNEAVDLMLESVDSDYLGLSVSITQLITPKAYGETTTRESFNGRTGIAFDAISAAEAAAGYSLTMLLAPQRMNRLAQQYDANKDLPSPSSIVKKMFERTLLKNETNTLSQRISMVAFNVFFDTLKHDDLAPEVSIAMQSELLFVEKWLKKNDRTSFNKMLLQHIQHYWNKGEWPAHFVVKQLPPGSPI